MCLWLVVLVCLCACVRVLICECVRPGCERVGTGAHLRPEARQLLPHALGVVGLHLLRGEARGGGA